MYSRLFKGLNQDEKDALKYEYEKSFRFREHITKVLEEELETIYIAMRDPENYGKDWAYKQADLVGQARTIKKLINYLK